MLKTIYKDFESKFIALNHDIHDAETGVNGVQRENTEFGRELSAFKKNFSVFLGDLFEKFFPGCEKDRSVCFFD